MNYSKYFWGHTDYTDFSDSLPAAAARHGEQYLCDLWNPCDKKNAYFRALTHKNFDLWPKSLQKPVVLPIMDSECAYRGTVSSCRSPILFALTDFSPIMRASIVGGASSQWERAYH